MKNLRKPLKLIFLLLGFALSVFMIWFFVSNDYEKNSSFLRWGIHLESDHEIISFEDKKNGWFNDGVILSVYKLDHFGYIELREAMTQHENLTSIKFDFFVFRLEQELALFNDKAEQKSDLLSLFSDSDQFSWWYLERYTHYLYCVYDHYSQQLTVIEAKH